MPTIPSPSIRRIRRRQFGPHVIEVAHFNREAPMSSGSSKRSIAAGLLSRFDSWLAEALAWRATHENGTAPHHRARLRPSAPNAAVLRSMNHTMSGGRASRDKGNRTERAIVRLLQDRGFAADVCRFRALPCGRFGGVPLLGLDRRVEVKCRGDGFRELYRWLDSADFLSVKCDRGEPLAMVALELAAEIAAMSERGRTK
jgi:hypothetical protein